MEQNFFESDNDINGASAVSSLKQHQDWEPLSNSVTENNDTGSFDCNICLDSANEPVVTLCGHLYCWPCIYKWLQVRPNSDDTESLHRNCPVCKAAISHSSLVPLYGRGSEPKKPIKPNSNSNSNSNPSLALPRRPVPTPSTSPSLNHHHHHLHSHELSPGYYFPSGLNPYGPIGPRNHLHHHHHHFGGGAVMTSLISPTIGVFGEMVLTRMFGVSGAGGGLVPMYPPAATMSPPTNGSPRMRRQEVQVDKSLNRVSIFLFCCIILCLLLF